MNGLRLTFLFFLLMGMTSCREYQGSDLTEKDHPVIKEARLLVQEQNLTDAKELLQDLLRSNPDLALAHMQLGMIYQSEERSIDALYHFQRYVEARPNGPKSEILAQVMEDERRRLAAAVQFEALPDDSPLKEIEALKTRLAETEQLLAMRELDLQQSKLNLGDLPESAPPEWAQERLQLLRTIQKLQMSGGVTDQNSSIPEEVSASLQRQTYTVKRGDTLSGIAKQVYGKASDWQKIYEANKEQIPNKNVVSQGLVLIIP